jgi:hypothetical protein
MFLYPGLRKDQFTYQMLENMGNPLDKLIHNGGVYWLDKRDMKFRKDLFNEYQNVPDLLDKNVFIMCNFKLFIRTNSIVIFETEAEISI